MHPMKIIKSVKIEGGSIRLVDGGLKIEDSSHVSEALQSFVGENKVRIAKYLRGDYDEKKGKIDDANDKLVDFMTGYDVDTHKAIDEFLRADAVAIDLVVKRMQILWHQGWQGVESTSNYEDAETDKLAEEIYNRAVDYGKRKKGAA
ncbi:hypothetical protein NSQ26_09650 [Bacillus sp. FSL W7-1360]